MDWLKKVLSSLWLLPIRLKSNIIINKVLFLKTTISVSKTSEIVISDATIIRNSMKIRGNNSYVSAVNSSITNSQIVIDGDNCHLILQEGTMINNSKIVIRGVNCAIEIGEGTTIGSGDFGCMGIGNSINIGARCMIADNVDVWATDSHPIVDRESGNLLNTSSSILIADHVWIGKSASVLKGVKVGQGSVIGMKSVVTHDVEPYSLYVGVPAKKIKGSIMWERNFIKQ